MVSTRGGVKVLGKQKNKMVVRPRTHKPPADATWQTRRIGGGGSKGRSEKRNVGGMT